MRGQRSGRKKVVVAAALLVTLAAPAWAGYGEGLAAYKRGDYVTAAEWYRKAAKQGHVEAQFFLGFMYKKGKGVPQDYALAAEWYRKAAEQGYAKAQSKLGFY